MKPLAALILLLAVVGAPVPLFAQGVTLEAQLPGWAQEKWRTLAKARMLTISNRINPFVWRGDFDGDGRPDIALLVKHASSGKEGIAILSRANVSNYVLGAGTPFGNGGDDFAWIDFWNVEDRGALLRSQGAVRLRADGLFVAKEGSGSALIYIENGKAKWQQQGD